MDEGDMWNSVPIDDSWIYESLGWLSGYSLIFRLGSGRRTIPKNSSLMW